MGLKNLSLSSRFLGNLDGETDVIIHSEITSSGQTSIQEPLYVNGNGNQSLPSESATSTKLSLKDQMELRASLPSSWYTSENFFALETRAIFSQVLVNFRARPLTFQAWHCLTHSNRFETVGTYYRYNIGTYPIFLILSKDGLIRGFHNICRHRGFPVVSKDQGCSSIIGCRYHGWSYNTNGQLVKVIVSRLAPFAYARLLPLIKYQSLRRT
jgi:hypothetical protein